MKLQDHPFIKWPAVWVEIHAGKHLFWGNETLGNLVEVSRSAESKALILATDYAGERYLGALICHDPEFAQKLQEFLKHQVGKPIRDVADLDIFRLL